MLVLWDTNKHGIVLDEALRQRLKDECDNNLEDLSSCINHLLTPQSKDIKFRNEVDDIVRDLKAIQNRDLLQKESDILKFLAQWDVDFKAGTVIVTKSDLVSKTEESAGAIVSEEISKGQSSHSTDVDDSASESNGRLKELGEEIAELQKWKTSLADLHGLNVKDILDDYETRIEKLEGQTLEGQTEDKKDIDLGKDSQLNRSVEMLRNITEGLQFNFTQMNTTLNQHNVLIVDIQSNVTDLNQTVLTMKQNFKNLMDKVDDHKVKVDGKLDAHDKRIRAVVDTDLPDVRRGIGFVNETAVNAFDVANGTKKVLLQTIDDHKEEVGGKLDAHDKRISALVDTDLPDIRRDIGIANNNAVNAIDLASETKQSIEFLQQNEKDLADIITKDKLETDRRLQTHDTQIGENLDTHLPDIRNNLHETKKTAVAAETLANLNSRDLKDLSNLTTSRHVEYEKYREETKSKQGESSYKHSVSEEIIEEMRRKMILYDAAFYMGIFSIGCCVMIIMAFVKNKTAGVGRETRTSDGKQPRPREKIDVYNLTWKGPMESSVCVVTFHSETERQHTTETKSVFESGGATLPVIHTRLIRRHTDIQDLPGSRIFMVFIDFNERNVILEDPNKGLGDLRVTTVRSLWKFGGDVTVIYCRDQGSRQLGGELFNRDLSSIYSQHELSQLKNQQRILSIFEGFSDYQKEHCRDFINRQLKRA